MCLGPGAVACFTGAAHLQLRVCRCVLQRFPREGVLGALTTSMIPPLALAEAGLAMQEECPVRGLCRPIQSPCKRLGNGTVDRSPFRRLTLLLREIGKCAVHATVIYSA